MTPKPKRPQRSARGQERSIMTRAQIAGVLGMATMTWGLIFLAIFDWPVGIACLGAGLLFIAAATPFIETE